MNTMNIQVAGISAVPYLDQWCGAWLIEPEHLTALVQAVQSLNLQNHLAAQQAASKSRNGYAYTTIENGVAVIEVRGTMMKHQASMGAAASTVELRRDIRALLADDSVSKAMLLMESPGGTAAGTAELAADVARLNAAKPVTAFIEDIGASAAYWVASQASKVYANAMAKVGSIGTYAVVQDLSGAAAMQGVKVHVVRAGEHKGAGTPGTEVTPEQLADMQRIINGINDGFLAGVASGRGVSIDQVRQLADGRVHLAADAKKLGLVDGVMSFDEAFDRVSRSRTSSKGRQKMSEKTAALANEIKAACPGITADTVLNYLSAGKSIEECTSAYVQEIATELEVAKEQLKESQAALESTKAELAEAKAQVEKAAKTPGVDGLEEPAAGVPSETSAAEAFNAIVAEKIASGLPRAKAVAAAVKTNRDLHQRMLAEVNAR